MMDKESPFNTPSPIAKRNLMEMGALSKMPKYSAHSNQYKERASRLVKMMIKCSLPVSLFNKTGFVEWLEYIDPSFSVPCEYTIKTNYLVNFTLFVENKLRTILEPIKHVNISLDLWSDATLRSFNGIIVHGKKIL
jgi:hypothetical protein